MSDGDFDHNLDFEPGLNLRRDVLGEAHVARLTEARNCVNEPVDARHPTVRAGKAVAEFHP